MTPPTENTAAEREDPRAKALRAEAGEPGVASRGARHALGREWPRPVALVLSGGAALGAVQVGMLRALAERGLEPDFIVGTSIGALNGAYIAAEGLSVARVEGLARIWAGLTARDVFTGMGIASLLRLAAGGGSLCSDRGLRRVLRYLPERHEDLAVPLFTIAFDLASGQSATLGPDGTFGGGALHLELLASSAIPLVFPKVTLAGRGLVDGGLVANCPLLEAEKLGARTLVVLDAGFPCAWARPPRGAVGELLFAFQRAMRQHAELALRLVAGSTAVVYLPTPCPLSLAHHDFEAAREAIAPAHQVASAFLDRLGEVGPGLAGAIHHHEGTV